VVFPEGPEVDQSPPASAEVKNEWSHTSFSTLNLHGVERDMFTFTPFFGQSFLPLKLCALYHVELGLSRAVFIF
jgi:hypothetical protein